MNSKLTVETWFPTNIAYIVNKDLLPHLKSIFQEIDWKELEDERYFNGYTTFFAGAEYNENLKNNMPQFIDFVIECAYQFAYSQGIDLCQYRLQVSNLWLSRMLRNGNHPKHLHTHSLYSGTYYVTADESNSPIRFSDARLFRQFSPILAAAEIVEYRPEEGKLLLWDAYLEHEVDTNMTDSVRDAISFNIDFIKKL